jgi:hypothetical protein
LGRRRRDQTGLDEAEENQDVSIDEELAEDERERI